MEAKSGIGKSMFGQTYAVASRCYVGQAPLLQRSLLHVSSRAAINKSPPFQSSQRQPNFAETGDTFSKSKGFNSSRVILRIDVSYTEHSHIIGKGGRNSQAVMRDTDCRIHFPDSNKDRSPDAQKSNEELSSLQIRFNIDLASLRPEVDLVNLKLDRLAEELALSKEVSVALRLQRPPAASFVHVRGSIGQAERVKEAVNRLFDYVYSAGKTVPPCSTLTEILPAQQEFVTGASFERMQWLSEKSGATVRYPSVAERHNGASTFCLTGRIEQVIAARLLLIELLPIELQLNMSRPPKQADVNVVEKQLGVTVLVEAPEAALYSTRHTSGVTILAEERGLANVLLAGARLMAADLPKVFSSSCNISAVYDKTADQQKAFNEEGRLPLLWRCIESSKASGNCDDLAKCHKRGDRAPNLCVDGKIRFDKISSSAQFSGYLYRKLAATKVMREDVTASGTARVPTRVYCGNGFSRTTPSSLLSSRNVTAKLLDPGRHALFVSSLSTAQEIASSTAENHPTDWSGPLFRGNLAAVLLKLKLANHLTAFEKEEVDFDAFLMMSDSDFKQFGIWKKGDLVRLRIATRQLRKAFGQPNAV